MTEPPPPPQQVVARFPDGVSQHLDIGPGWFDLVAQLDADLAALDPNYVLHQCKAKYASLRYDAEPTDYNMPWSDRFLELISEASERSETLCEQCGSPSSMFKFLGWLWTLCEEHAEELRALHKKGNPAE